MNCKQSNRLEDLRRIRAALIAATHAVLLSLSLPRSVEYKESGDPVTQVDRRINAILREHLMHQGDSWLSEETADDLIRLEQHRVWVVDPIDGTREFISGIPEWCLSVALVEEGQAAAGGVLNPMTNQLVLGSLETGVTLNGMPVDLAEKTSLAGCMILASRSEVRRGEWECFRNRGYEIRPMGSIAYKLSLVASGLADATWTFSPKNEWDVAAGVALVKASGGEVYSPHQTPLEFNRPRVLLHGLVAHRRGLAPATRNEIRSCMQ